MTESLLFLLPFPPNLEDKSLECSKRVLQVIKNSKTNVPELELFPRYLLFLRQQPATRTQQSNVWVNMGMMSLRMFPQHLPRGNLKNAARTTTTNPPVQFLGQPRLGELFLCCVCAAARWPRGTSGTSRAFPCSLLQGKGSREHLQGFPCPLLKGRGISREISWLPLFLGELGVRNEHCRAELSRRGRAGHSHFGSDPCSHGVGASVPLWQCSGTINSINAQPTASELLGQLGFDAQNCLMLFRERWNEWNMKAIIWCSSKRQLNTNTQLKSVGHNCGGNAHQKIVQE